MTVVLGLLSQDSSKHGSRPLAVPPSNTVKVVGAQVAFIAPVALR